MGRGGAGIRGTAWLRARLGVRARARAGVVVVVGVRVRARVRLSSGRTLAREEGPIGAPS